MSPRAPLFYAAQGLGGGLERMFGGIGTGMQQMGQGVGQAGLDHAQRMKENAALQREKDEAKRGEQFKAASVEGQLAYGDDLGTGAGGMPPPPGYQRQHVEDRISRFKMLSPEQRSTISGSAELGSRESAAAAAAAQAAAARKRQDQHDLEGLKYGYRQDDEMLKQQHRIEIEEMQAKNRPSPGEKGKSVDDRLNFHRGNYHKSVAAAYRDPVTGAFTDLPVPVLGNMTRAHISWLMADEAIPIELREIERDRIINEVVGRFPTPGASELAQQLRDEYLGGGGGAGAAVDVKSIMDLVPPDLRGDAAGFIESLPEDLSAEEVTARLKQWVNQQPTERETERAASPMLQAPPPGVVNARTRGMGQPSPSPSPSPGGMPRGVMDAIRSLTGRGGPPSAATMGARGVPSPSPSRGLDPAAASALDAAGRPDPFIENARTGAVGGLPATSPIGSVDQTISDLGLRVTSGARTSGQNQAVGGVAGSMHTQGKARDIGTRNPGAPPQAIVADLAEIAQTIEAEHWDSAKVIVEIPRGWQGRVMVPPGVQVKWINDRQPDGRPAGAHVHVEERRDG